MNVKPLLVWLFCFVAGPCLLNSAIAQSHQNLTVVYEITIEKNKNKAGIEETYNGGTKAVFISSKKARIRLTSLARIQSIFFDFDSSLRKATVIKESGKNKYLFNMMPAEWKQYNKKYDSLVCNTSFTESLTIKGYPCKKAVITTGDGKQVTLFYTERLVMNNAMIEPLFRCIKGTVLQYEVKTSKGRIVFKASEISTGNIDDKVFVVPAKGVKVKKYNSTKKAIKEEAEESE